jgi:hypothetical protein
MRRFALAMAMLVLAAGSASAKAPPKHHAAPLRHRVSYRRHYRRQRLHFSAEMKDDGRTPTLDRAALRHDTGYMRPMAVSRLGKTGAYAAFGYNTSAVKPTLQPGELNGAADTRLSHGESAAGVKVGIPF